MSCIKNNHPMSVKEALSIIKSFSMNADEKVCNHLAVLIDHIKQHNKVYPWVETEIRYLGVLPMRSSECRGVCDGAVAAEAQYNGTSMDSYFDLAVDNYEQ